MRLPSLAALVGLLAVAAGCDSTPPLPSGSAPLSLEQGAGKFHNDAQSNRTVSGEQVPLTFIDSAGNKVDLKSFHGKANVVLVVVKGLPPQYGGQFCPGCLAQVNSLTANHAEFTKRGAEILMVFPGPKDALPQFLAAGKVDGADGNPKVPFALLLDTDLNAVKTLGISGELAKPSTYILDKKGNVVFAFVGGDTYDRPSVQALLAQLDN